MNFKLIAAAFLALAVVVTGAAAAAPGNAPVDAPTNDQTDAADAGDATAAEGEHPERAEHRERAEVGQRGPPADLPSQVPDFVGEIHDLIRQHVSGSLDGVLGHEISDVTPDNETDAGEPAGNASQA